MKNDYTAPLRIVNDAHLKDIFYKDFYLELGIIDVSIIRRLLNKEIIDIDELTFYPIQNKGLGHSNSKDQGLRNTLPYFFYHKLSENNQQYQLVIVYGLYRYRDIDKFEKFAPIILIPIKIYYENSNIVVKMTSRPFENPLLYKIFKNTSKVSFLQTESYMDIYSLDNVIHQIEKLSPRSVRIDNFLTFVEIKMEEIILPNKKLLNNTSSSLFKEEMTYRSSNNFFYSQILNKTQRVFIRRAMNDENLTLTGYSGTGKTTVLKNIIVNKLYQKKKIMYVSDSFESIDDMEEYLIDCGLGRYLINLCKSTNELVTQNLGDNYGYNDEKIKETNKELQELYTYCDSFEQIMNETIFDFKFVDLLKRFFLIENGDKIKNVLANSTDDLNYIYKHEYKIIKEALELIETNSKKIKSFKDSVWNQIPILNNIKYVNQVINVVFQLNTGFKKLREYEIQLEKYGVKAIQSFSRMKKCIYPMEKFTINAIPKKWIENVEIFYRSRNKYQDLKDSINRYQEAEYLLSTKYKNLSLININDEINKLYGSFYTTNEDERIINVLNHKGEITRMMESGESEIKKYEDTCEKLSTMMEWDFQVNDENIHEMEILISLMKEETIYGKLFCIVKNSKDERTIQSLKQKLENIKKYQNEIDSIYKNNPKHTKKRTKDPTSIHLFEEIEAREKKIHKIEKEYVEICGDSIQNIEKHIGAIIKSREYFLNLKSKSFRKKIIEFLSHIEKNDYPNILKLFTDFIDSKNNILKVREYFKSFVNAFADLSLFDSIKVLKEYFNYFKALMKSQDTMKEIIINCDEKYCLPTDYYTIKKEQEEYKNIVNSLQTNSECKDLFEYLYVNEETNVQNVMKILQMYDAYRVVFKTDDDCLNSFKDYTSLNKLVMEISELVFSLGENLRLYSLIFKDSVSRYYFSNIEENIKYLSNLLEARDELVIYLNITQGIGILNNYNLTGVMNYIVENDELDNLTSEFTYIYFKNIITKTFEKHELLRNHKNYIDNIDTILHKEDELCKMKRINLLRDLINENNYSLRRKDLNYNEYSKVIKKNNKKIKVVLTNSDQAKEYIAGKRFDLVIIDDAHTITSGEYSTLFKGKQVIICGDYQTNKVVNQNLISLTMGDESSILRKRLVLGPRKLTYNLPITSCPYMPTYKENIGIEKITKDIEKYIYNLYIANKKVRINFFIKNIYYQKIMYETIAAYFLYKGISGEEIKDFLDLNLCIVDIDSRSYIHSDYDIIYFYDYYHENSQIVASNFFETLMISEKGIIVYDDHETLEKDDINDLFYSMIKGLLNNQTSNVFLKDQNDQISNLIAKILIEKGYSVYFPGNGINLSFSPSNSNELVSLIILYSNGYVYDVMSNYRDIYDVYIKKGHKIIIKTMLDLILGPQAFVAEICEEYNGQRK